ncbi:hypothetical protein SH580_18730 [Coraliomargarita algicola]|uniref:Uncharacterized protein n=1 Tax=Coraliomargarita algicola TaxID=3092156 RepID=A0ABZ0RK56_9BACT|nr:hypothetical protein [Coraliomargarita sp. J2-16]WPJ95458.1 hypothetical protein SH580_18730 [Coraliomargarita sp. J2-16]
MNGNYRQLKPSELKELSSFVSPATNLIRWILFLILFLPGAFLLFKLNVSIASGVASYAWLVVTAFFGLWLLKKFNRWSGGSEFRSAVKKDIAGSQAFEEQHFMNRCVMFEEVEDEGRSYLVENSAGIVFFFSGQELPKNFPKFEVTVVKAPYSNHLFKIYAKGDVVETKIATASVWDQLPKAITGETYVKTSFRFDDILQQIT